MGLSLKSIANPLKWISAPIDWAKDIVEHPEHVADRQRNAELEAWKMQQEYNTPANQVKRYYEAGLNPNAYFSQISSGNASSAPNLPVGDKASSINSILGYASNAFGMAMQLKQLQAAKEKNAADLLLATDNLEFQKQRWAADLAMREKELAWRKDNAGKFHGTTALLSDLITNTLGGKSPTDVASDTHNVLRQVVNEPFKESDHWFINLLMDQVNPTRILNKVAKLRGKFGR